MKTTTQHGILTLTLLLSGASAASAQGIQPLLGAWHGTSAEVRGARILIERNFATIDQNRVPLRYVSPGVLMLGPAGDQERVQYRLQGGQLRLSYLGETSAWQRASAGALPPLPVESSEEGGAAEDRPLRVRGATGTGPEPGRSLPGNPLGGNPLGGGTAAGADPYLGSFSGQGVRLQLRRQGAGYLGSLGFRGQEYPVQAQRRGALLEGRFRAGAQEYPFSVQVQDAQLRLQTGGREYLLAAAPTSRTRNPLAQGRPSEEVVAVEERSLERGSELPPGSKAYVNKTAGLACHLPAGWSVVQESREGLGLNPGYRRGERMLCSVGLVASKAEAGARQKPIADLLEAELADFQRSLAANGVQVDLRAKQLSRFRVQGSEAAAIVAPARTSAGLSGSVWLALRIDGDTALACSAVYMQGAEAQLGGKVRAVFASLRRADQTQGLPR